MGEEETTPLGDAVPERDAGATSARPSAAAPGSGPARDEREPDETGEPPRLRDMRRARDRPPG